MKSIFVKRNVPSWETVIFTCHELNMKFTFTVGDIKISNLSTKVVEKFKVFTLWSSYVSRSKLLLKKILRKIIRISPQWRILRAFLNYQFSPH